MAITDVGFSILAAFFLLLVTHLIFLAGMKQELRQVG